jgi:hypothetical protein
MLRGFFTADSGAPTGASAQPTELPKKTETPPETGVADEKRFTQTELEQQIKERLARQQRQFEAQQREAQAALEAKQLEEQAEWQKLANRRADELKELKPRAQLAESYEKAVRALVDAQTRDVPANIQMILEKLSLVDQLDWLAANAGTIKPATASGATNINAYGRSAAAPALTDEQFLEKKRREGTYQ